MSHRMFLTGMLALGLLGLPGAARAAPAEKPAATPEADAKTLIRLVSIEVQGNKQIPRADIVGALGLHEGQEVAIAELQAGLQRVAKMGTFSAVVPTLTPAELGGMVLTLQVRENPVLRSFRIEGARHFKPGQIARPFESLRGKILAVPALKKAIAEVEERYAKDGLVLARLYPLSLTADGLLVLQVREGVLDSLKIEGNRRTQESVIRRELTLKQGDLVTQRDLQENLNRLGRLGFFDDVTPQLDPASGSLGYDLTLRVKERNTGRVSTSAGWSATEGPLAQLSLSNDNFMGRGQSVGASLWVSRMFDPANRNLTTELSFVEPWLDDRRTSLGAAVYVRRFYNPFARLDDGSIGFQDQRGGASVTMGRPLFGDPIATPWRGFVTLKGEQASIGRADPAGNRTELPFASLTGSGRDLGVSGAVTVQYDTRNQAINPSTGWLVKATGEQYAPFADLKFSKLSLEASHYLPAAPFLTLALGTRFGGMTDFFGAGIPAYQRYYSYGDYLIRGWRDAEFGGNSFALASLEGRFPIYSVISGVAFGDTGAFWGTSGAPLAWSSLRSGYGLGLRVDTPMGVIRADYGLHTWGESGQFSIGIGQRF